jgi:plasmid stabilization system protein ParE
MDVRFHPSARSELRAAFDWYQERSAFTAAAFAQAVDSAVSKIAEAPMRFEAGGYGTRRYVIERFPFTIFYIDLGLSLLS